MAGGILVFLFVCLCAVKSDGNIGTDLFCVDPDDGSSHPVNSTWFSSTFCGNYTCKIRKKNQNNTNNIEKHLTSEPDSINSIDNNNLRNNHVIDQSHAGSETQVVFAKSPAKMSPYPIFHKEKKLNTDKNKTNTIKYFHEKIMNSINEKDDRYLTESEINTISELLHTVKKSDLETMAEIYSLAKDIFKEIDAKPDEAEMIKIEDDIINQIYENTKSKSAQLPKKNSYFYEPLLLKNSVEIKDVASHAGPPVIPTPVPYIPHPVPHTMPYNQINYQPQPYVPIPSQIPPQSNIQKVYSYRHPITAPPVVSRNNNQGERNGSCLHFPFTHAVVKTPFAVEPAKVNQVRNQRPALLPYPFSYVYRNDLRPEYVYYNPFEQFDIRPRSNQQNYAKPNELPNVNTISKDDIDDYVETKVKDEDSDEDLVERVLPTYKRSQDKTLKPWQTEELTSQILNDIRANFTNKKQSIFPVQKMRLDRIGKVIKLDDIFRVKRSMLAENDRKYLNDEYEAFVEKITCPISTELGFFRMGNQSLPFPQCCPQKIATHNNT